MGLACLITRTMRDGSLYQKKNQINLQSITGLKTFPVECDTVDIITAFYTEVNAVNKKIRNLFISWGYNMHP